MCVIGKCVIVGKVFDVKGDVRCVEFVKLFS